MIKFDIKARIGNGRGRAGVIETPHGSIETPAFIPVGTKATIKAVTTEQVRDEVGAHAILANTYHLYLQPGPEILRKAGGLGKFMNWSGPTFTDSGGFQAFSLAGGMQEHRSKIQNPEAGRGGNVDSRPLGEEIPPDSPRGFEGGVYSPEKDAEKQTLAKFDDDGVSFKSIIDGSSHRFTPERSIEIQHDIGADIIFAFDECISPQESYERQKEAVERTTRWAKRCLEAHGKEKGRRKEEGAGRKEQDDESALFGIVQGGRYEDLRKQSAREIGAMGFEGFGIGGSFDKDDIGTAVGWVADVLPENKPRHLLGIGQPMDLILGIENGMDTFDCVAPTRIARNGSAYVNAGASKKLGSTINLLNAQFREDFTPIDNNCGCYTCKNYTKAYMAHLFRAKEMLAATLVSVHNLYFLVNLVKRARQAIIEGKFEEFKKGIQ